MRSLTRVTLVLAGGITMTACGAREERPRARRAGRAWNEGARRPARRQEAQGQQQERHPLEERRRRPARAGQNGAPGGGGGAKRLPPVVRAWRGASLRGARSEPLAAAAAGFASFGGAGGATAAPSIGTKSRRILRPSPMRCVMPRRSRHSRISIARPRPTPMRSRYSAAVNWLPGAFCATSTAQAASCARVARG